MKGKASGEAAQTSWDALVLSVLAFMFLFLAVYFASDGRVLEMVVRQLEALGGMLGGSPPG
ncbi:MAG: hypothetical protein V1787_01270 [Candidatus Micrarchaeota archaeon]